MAETNKDISTEVLYYLAGAFRNAIEGGFFAREHAASIFKTCLKVAGYELPQNKKTRTQDTPSEE